MARAVEVGFWQAQGSLGLYKRNQGRITRQLTALAVVLVVALGAWQLSQFLTSYGYARPVAQGIPLGIAVLGTWFAYRLVNWPRFADFLIAVEAEMDKVSWPNRQELQRATAVVIVTMLFIGFVLLTYDIFWAWFFTLIRILKPTM